MEKRLRNFLVAAMVILFWLSVTVIVDHFFTGGQPSALFHRFVLGREEVAITFSAYEAVLMFGLSGILGLMATIPFEHLADAHR